MRLRFEHCLLLKKVQEAPVGVKAVQQQQRFVPKFRDDSVQHTNANTDLFDTIFSFSYKLITPQYKLSLIKFNAARCSEDFHLSFRCLIEIIF